MDQTQFEKILFHRQIKGQDIKMARRRFLAS